MSSAQAQLPDHLDDDGFSFTTACGFEVVFDGPSNTLLLFDAQGSEIVLSLTTLREILGELKKPCAAGLLRRLSTR